jgi:hypothetical protein
MNTLLRLLTPLAFAACVSSPTDEVDPSGAGGKADDETTSSAVTIAQAGAFSSNTQPVAKLMHYGFMPRGQMGPGWTPAGDVEIEYDGNGESLPVRVPAGGAPTGTVLGFAIMSVDQYSPSSPSYGYQVWSDDQYIDLAAKSGTLVKLPVVNSAGYPFEPECYRIHVDGATYDGRIAHAFYGLTDASATDYASNNNVAWHDLFGNPQAAGVFYPTVRHDGGYKGTMRTMPHYAWVPDGQHLVFKLALDKFSGQCGTSGDTRFYEHAETKTYFVDAS